jgi:hypothetical protein
MGRAENVIGVCEVEAKAAGFGADKKERRAIGTLEGVDERLAVARLAVEVEARISSLSSIVRTMCRNDVNCEN